MSAFTSSEGVSRQVLRRVLNDSAEALISIASFAEYEAVLARRDTQRRCPLTVPEQIRIFDAFLSRTQLVEVYYRWRPNLPDEGDNHVLELAVAAGDAPSLPSIGAILAVANCDFHRLLYRRPGSG